CSVICFLFCSCVLHIFSFCCTSFFFYCSAPHRPLHSFPTRRSSDLTASARRSGSTFTGARISRRSSAARRRSSASPSTRIVAERDRKSTRLNSSHVAISYAVFCLKKKKKKKIIKNNTYHSHFSNTNS